MGDDGATVRRAGPGDVGALIALRALMFAAMGQDVDLPGWREAATAWFVEQLAGPDASAFVIEHSVDGVVAGAAGLVDLHAPSPSNPSGRVGELFNVATLPGFRGRGHARRAVTAVLEWFDGEADVGVVRLTATDDGLALYRSVGFAEPDWTPMRRVTRSREQTRPH